MIININHLFSSIKDSRVHLDSIDSSEIASFFNSSQAGNRAVIWDGRNHHMPKHVKSYVKQLSDDMIQDYAKNLSFSDTRSCKLSVPKSDWEVIITLTTQLNHYFVEEALVVKPQPKSMSKIGG